MPCEGAGYQTIQNSVGALVTRHIGHPCHVEIAVYTGIGQFRERIGGVDYRTWTTNLVIFDTTGDTTLITVQQTSEDLYFQVVSNPLTPTPSPSGTPVSTPTGFSTPPPTQTLTVTVPESGGFDIALVVLAITAFVAFWKYLKRIVF